MIQKNLRIEPESAALVGQRRRSAHDMLRSIHRLLAPNSSLPRQVEEVPLKSALARVVAEDVHAKFDSPLFDESLRDGFAIVCDQPVGSREKVVFKFLGETGAGDRLEKKIGQQETWKVMTGGVVPDNCTHVVPQEWCLVQGETVTIASERLHGPRFVKRRGCDRKKGSLIAGVGDVITPAALVTIADGGWGNVKVFRRPRVCFCCTGKELVEVDSTPGSAQKISSNQYLLGALIEQHGCVPHDYGIVGDDVQAVDDYFRFALDESFDLVLTTGGTGGGAFDLVEKGFVDAGGTVVCNSIDVRPGKSLIAGEKKETLYVGLPGPPSAVHTVFLEIVVPLLMVMRGLKADGPRRISVIAGEDIVTKTKGTLLIKEGVLAYDEGTCQVRLAGKGESSHCNILISPGRDVINRGETVEIHFRDPVWQ